MASSYDIFPIAVIIGMSVSSIGCAATEVYSHGGSTTVVTQSGGGGPRSTDVTRTPDGQRVISRSGSNVDISEQSSSSKGISDPDDGRRSGRGSRDCVDDEGGFFGAFRRMMWPSSKCSSSPTIRGEPVPTSEEYKDRMQSRMRSVSPKP